MDASKELNSLPWAVTQLERKLSHEHIQALSLVATGFGIERQELEKVLHDNSLIPLFSLLQRNVGSDSKAFALLVWMLERIGYNYVHELKQHPRYEPIEEIARKFVGADFLLTIYSIFSNMSEKDYRSLLHLVTKEHLGGISPDRVPNRANLIQRMLDKELICERQFGLLYHLLEHYQINRLCRILDDYCSRHNLVCLQMAIQGFVESDSGNMVESIACDNEETQDQSSDSRHETSTSADSQTKHHHRPLYKWCTHKWFICPCLTGLFYIFIGLVGSIYYALAGTYDQSTYVISTNSTELEMGWNYSVKVNPYGLDPASNVSVNISSTFDANAQIFVTNCSTLHTITRTLVPALLELSYPLVSTTSALNYYLKNEPLYAVSGVLDYHCYVSSDSNYPSNDTCLEIFVFDNATLYDNFEVDQSVDKSNCLRVGSHDNPILNNVSFHLRNPSYYYVKAWVEAKYKLDCSGSGSISVYDLSGLTPDGCSLNWTNTWCAISIPKTIAGSQNDQNSSACILTWSSNDSTLTVSIDIVQVTYQVHTERKPAFSFLACLFASLLIIGVSVETFTGCMVWQIKRASIPFESDIELRQTLLNDADDDDDDDDD